MAANVPDAEQVRAAQREGWSAAAAGWTQRRAEMSAATRPVTERLIAAAKIAPGQRVLDLASGTGDPAFTIAEIVGPEGSVLGLDLTPAMVESATAYAREHGVTNVSFRAISSEVDLGVSPASFDAATCRFGLMFMADPAAALRSLLDALKPDGRVAFSTWGPLERVPFMDFPTAVIRRHAPAVPPPSTVGPGQFALPTEDALIGILTAAGFADANVEIFNTDVATAPSAAAYWDRTSETSGMMGRTLAGLSDAQQAAIRADVIQSLEAQFPDGPVALGGEVLVGSGVKPR